MMTAGRWRGAHMPSKVMLCFYTMYSHYLTGLLLFYGLCINTLLNFAYIVYNVDNYYFLICGILEIFP